MGLKIYHGDQWLYDKLIDILIWTQIWVHLTQDMVNIFKIDFVWELLLMRQLIWLNF